MINFWAEEAILSFSVKLVATEISSFSTPRRVELKQRVPAIRSRAGSDGDARADIKLCAVYTDNLYSRQEPDATRGAVYRHA